MAVYAAYGKAMIAAHSLERRMAALLLVRRAEKIESKIAVEVTDIDRLTLGQLIGHFAHEFSPPAALTTELGNMLYFRNLLAHRISHKILSAAQKDGWEENLVIELYEISGHFKETSEALQPYIDSCLSSFSLAYNSLMEKLLPRYTARTEG